MVSSVKGIVWYGGAAVAEVRRPPLKRGEVLGKVLAASITHIERLVSLGLIPTEVGRVLGSVGLIKVIDISSDLDSTLIGKYLLLLPRPSNIGGINFDGVLTEVVSIPYKLLMPISKYYASVPEVLIYAELSYIHEIVDHVKNKEVLVLGCGPTSYITVKYIKDLCNVYVGYLHNQQMRSKIAELGVYVANYENISKGDYDIIIILTADTYLALNILKLIKNPEIIVVPPTNYRVLINITKFNHNNVVKLLIPNYVISNHVFESLSNAFRDVKNLTGFINSFEEALGSMFYFWRTVLHINTSTAYAESSQHSG